MTLIITDLGRASQAGPEAVSKAAQRWKAEPNKTLSFRMGLYNPGSDFSIKPDRGFGVTYVPGESQRAYAELSYERISIGFQVPGSSEGQENAVKGTSSFRDLQIRSFGHRNNFEFIHQGVEGFALENWPDPDRPERWLRRGDLRLELSQFNLLQSLSPAHFSKAVALDSKGWQLRSGGALLAFLSIGEFRLAADQPILPASMRGSAGDVGQLRGLTSQFALIGTGYGQILTFTDHLFFGFTVLAGVGVRRQRFELDSLQDWSYGPAYRVGLRPILGYNSKNWISSLSLIVDSTNWRLANADFAQATFALKGTIGYRFEDVTIPFYHQIEREILNALRGSSGETP